MGEGEGGGIDVVMMAVHSDEGKGEGGGVDVVMMPCIVMGEKGRRGEEFELTTGESCSSVSEMAHHMSATLTLYGISTCRSFIRPR